jgi:thioredoxin-related protein
MYKKTIILTILLLLVSISVHSATPSISDKKDSDLAFDDSQLEEELVYPDWFKLSLGNLGDDLDEAKKAGKKGIISYFGQKRCAYCEQFFKTSLADIDIQNYLREHYDIIAFDIWGIEDITDTDGKKYTERELSLHYKTNFTPSLVFYDLDGTPVFRLRGYYPPYKFRAALQYVTEGFYKEETFAEYFARAIPGEYFQLGGLTERDFFLEEPYDLALLRKNNKPTAVFFEQGNCHACDLLHSDPLSKELSIKEIEKMNAVQLNMWAETAVTTPQGKKTTAKDWAKSLNLFYTPSIIFFDPDGNEIIRVDSVTHFYRLWGVLDYVNQQGYKKAKDYQEWRLQQRKISE